MAIKKVWVLALSSVAFVSPHARAQSKSISQSFAFQGYLTGLANGSYNMSFVFKKDAATIVPIAAPNVSVNSGIFSVVLNDASLNASLFYGTGPTNPTIDVIVDTGGGNLATFANIALSSVPSAFVAQNALSAFSLNLASGNGTANQVLTTDGAGNLSWATFGGGSTPSGPAGGALGGTYPNPSLAANSVTTAQIASNAVTNTQIAAGVSPSKISSTGATSGSYLRNDGTTWLPSALLGSDLSGPIPAAQVSGNFSAVSATGAITTTGAISTTSSLSAASATVNGALITTSIQSSSSNPLVLSSGAGQPLLLQNNATTRMIISNSGNVGFGTLTPGNSVEFASPLRISNGSPTAGAQLVSSNNFGDVSWVNAPPPMTTCPGGMTFVAGDSSHSSFCIDTGAMGASTGYAASIACAPTKSLCQAAELYRACSVGAVPGIASTIHWASDIASSVNWVIVGGTVCTTVSNASASAGSYSARCCSR